MFLFTLAEKCDMKTQISGNFVGKVNFIDQYKVKIEMPDNTYVAGFSTNYNYLTTTNGDDHFIRLMSSLFTFNMYSVPRPDFNTAFRNINSDLYRNEYEMMQYLIPEQNKDDERARIGARIRDLRKKNNIDAKALAARVGIDASNLSRIEQGHYSVGFDILTRIANALNARVEIVENLSDNGNETE